MGDTFSKRDLVSFKNKVLVDASKYGVKFFNCKKFTNNKSLNYPHALMNPSGVRDGVYVRERIDGSIIEANTDALDFKLLISMLFCDLPESLISTTQLIADDYLQELDK